MEVLKMWAARDKNGSLWLYPSEKPKRHGDEFRETNFLQFYTLDDRLLRDVTWENSPVEIVLTYAKNK